MKRTFFLSCLLAGVLLSVGCLGGNSVVPLTYPQQLADTPWCRWDLTVVDFTDARTRQELGAMDEETSYTAGSDLAEWVTRSLTSELEARGCTCSHVAEADPATSGFVVSGKVLSLALDKMGINQWTTRMEILVELTRNGKQLFAQTYTGTVERTFLIGTDGPQEIMAEGLSDILASAAVKMSRVMKDAGR
jgi:hypothetical protein